MTLHLSLLLTAVVLLPSTAARASTQAAEDVRVEARRLMGQGAYEQAESLLAAVENPDVHALRLKLELAWRKGDRRTSDSYARRILGFYEAGRLRTSAALGEAAYAARHLDRWHDSNNIFMEASEAEPPAFSTYVDWGHLFLEKYDAAEAEAIFQEALPLAEILSGYARWERDDALLGLARARRELGRPGAGDALNQALEINPRNPEAFSLKARRALREENWDEAEEAIRRGLDVNPQYLPLLDARAVLHYLRGVPDRFEAAREAVLAVNPSRAELFELLGDMALQQRRLAEAVSFYREAVERNPRYWSALSSLGINLLRLGQEEEGKQVLERAYANDPFNLWTVNTLRLLDSFERFERFETGRFHVRLHQREAAVLRPYVEDLLERSLTVLEERYGHRVQGRYFFEMYPDHEDFAVRTLGMPGLGALGAVIGRLVAMDSPSARPRGQFHWGSTLWHEVAHVVTLSLSNYRVPRWLTEGLSMLEERKAMEGWGERTNVHFVAAFRDGHLLPLEDLNSGFVNPESPLQLQNSYLQAGWTAEFLARHYGFEAIRSMLVAYGEEKSTEQVFEEVLGATVQEIDHRVREEMEGVLRPLVLRLDTSILRGLAALNPETGQAEVPLETLLQALEKFSDNYFLNLEAGRRLFEEERREKAAELLEKALEIFPHAAGEKGPYELLALIYEKAEETSKELEVRRRWWRTSPLRSENARRIAELLHAVGETESAAQWLEEALYVDPLEPRIHRHLGELYLELERAAEAEREFRVLLNLEPTDMAGARYLLAEALLLGGDPDSARREVLRALEVAPGYREAQQLLLRLVQP